MSQRRPLPDARVRLRQRIGDAERNVATEQLSSHFAAGRITNEEFDARLSKVMAARTTEDLWRQLSDLPTVRLPPKSTAALDKPERKWGAVDTVALVAIVGALVIAFPIMLSGSGTLAAATFMVGVLGAIGGAAFTLILTRHHSRAVDRRSAQLRRLGRDGGPGQRAIE